jgi:uncharacterized heparinase superfamily protein
VLPDGGLASRCPEEMLLVLQLLVSLRSLYAARQMEPPGSVVQAMDRLVPALRGLILGDGRLARFHGGGTATVEMIERTLAAATDGSRQPVRNAMHSGYQRLEGGKAIVVADAGPPPPGRLSARAHAGSLSFEFSDGPQRLIINCGNEFEQPGALAQALRDSLRGTTAHSTLSIDDVNSTLFRSDGLLGKGVAEITAVRQENGDGSWLDMVHDGYGARYGFAHRRRLFLSADGFDLRGEDLLEPFGRRRDVQPVIIRFHLAPGVMAIPTQSNSSAALKLPNGTAWMFRCRGASLSIADSIAIEEGQPRKAYQLVLSAQAQPSGSSINWLFQRSK